MNPGALKYIAEKLDWVLFSLKGEVQSQSENMSKLSSGAVEADLYDRFPLLESIREVLAGLPEGEELVLPCIYSEMGGKAGWYDYIFCRENGEENEPLVRWCIFDLSPQYIRMLALQQSIQESKLNGAKAYQVDDEEFPATGPSRVLDVIEKQNRLILRQLDELRQELGAGEA